MTKTDVLKMMYAAEDTARDMEENIKDGKNRQDVQNARFALAAINRDLKKYIIRRRPGNTADNIWIVYNSISNIIHVVGQYLYSDYPATYANIIIQNSRFIIGDAAALFSATIKTKTY